MNEHCNLDDTLLSARVRAAQIHTVFRFTPLTMAANLVNASVLYIVIHEGEDSLQVALWTFSIVVVALATMRTWFKSRGRIARQSASIRAIKRATLHAFMLGAMWAVVPVLWFSHISIDQQLIIACLITGMICAGGFALSAIPTAAYAYVIVLTLGASTGLFLAQGGATTALAILLFVYSLIILQSVASYSKLFRERFTAEASLTMRGEIIELLLAEFEQNGSDWLFETDPALTITSHSPRFAEVCNRTGESLAGITLSSLIHPDSLAAFLEQVERLEPFRDLAVRSADRSGLQWWALTAKPLSDDRRGHIGWRGVGSDITDRKEAGEKVAWMARTDMRTRLPNRSSFRELVAERSEAARSAGRPFAVGCLDLDQFKAVNDTLGHPVGDLLLTSIARDLGTFIDEGLVIGRIGGDEFGIIFDQFADASDVVAVSERIIAKISRSKTIKGARITVGASIGLAFDAGADRKFDDLIRNADLALYGAKGRGRGVAVVYDDAMHRNAEEHRILIEDLRLALAGDELRLHYQPIVDARSRRVVAFEALIRWEHPTRGLLAPTYFIPLAEEGGMIDAIGAWVIRRACLDASGWPGRIRVAVNLSPVQFGNAALLDRVVESLAESGLPADRLELEITEALLMSDTKESIRILTELRSLGIRIALDDFGTGYSSLGYLTRFPIHKLKIDRSFISGASAIENRKAVVEAIVGIARSLDLETTAEGVETATELVWIRGLGCEQVQGYYYSRPVPNAELPDLIARIESNGNLAEIAQQVAA